MSEVDRLSNSGLYPALPISDKRKDSGSPGQPPPGGRDQAPDPKGGADTDPNAPRIPKSLIDEYA
jgi:hypothetical protein